jgi:uncharacterized membrane protein
LEFQLFSEKGLPFFDLTIENGLDHTSFNRTVMEPYRTSKERLGLFLLVLWIALFIGLRTLQHDSFGTNACDLSIFDYSLHSTLHGQLMANPFHQYAFGRWHRADGRLTFEAVRSKGWENLFGIHFAPVLFLVLPLYLVHDGPLTLLYLQVLLVGLAAAFLFLIARQVLKVRWAALAVAAVFLFFRHTLTALMYDFHQELFFPLFILAAYYFLTVNRKPALYFLFAALALAVKEDMPIYLFFFGLFVAFHLKEKALGFVTSAVSLVYFALVLGVFIPAFRAQEGLAGFYVFQNAYAGGQGGLFRGALYWLSHPRELLRGVDVGDFLKKLGDLFFPLLLFPVTTTYGLLILVPVMVAVASKMPQFYTFGLHYSAALLPFLFLALVHGLRAFLNRLSFLKPGLRRKVFAAAVILLLVANLANSSFWRIIPPSRYRALADHGRIHSLMKRLPDGASVAAQSALIPHLAKRKAIFMLPDLAAADYVLVHSGVNPWPYTSEEMSMFIAWLETGGGYVLLAQEGEARLFKKNRSGAP